jgi:signal transduction histidine kinase
VGRALGFASFLTGGLDPDTQRDELATVAALRTQFVRQAAAIRERSTGLYAGAGSDELFVDFTEAMDGQVDSALARRFDTAEFFDTITQDPDVTYQAYRERVAKILRDRADDVREAAARRERVYVAAILLTGALAIGTALVVVRSLTRPLRSLTDQVMDAAHHGLRQAVATVLGSPPDAAVPAPRLRPITVDSGDEVADVAAAMNLVQQSVVDLAVDQATMRRHMTDTFVSLGRRNQNLLSRQLAFITELQRTELDPEVLSQLFQLDHLATRMRRNAESLLVLAGEETPRTWTAPVGVADVVRAALGEVEDYQRVRISGVEPFTVGGHAAADLAHLLAELLENALLYSPPDEAVDVRGQHQPAGYTLAVIDAGVGMPAGEIAEANLRLAGAGLGAAPGGSGGSGGHPAMTVNGTSVSRGLRHGSGGAALPLAPSRYLGHYVAGHLAARHGIRVRLQNSAGPGITAVIGLPLSLSGDVPGSDVDPFRAPDWTSRPV